MERITIKVEPKVLKCISSDVLAKINKAESTFREIDNVVNRSYSYWEGSGHDGMNRLHISRRDDYQKILRELKVHIQNLQQIAGVYEQTEKISTQVSMSLDANVIE